MTDTPETREEARQRGYRDRRLDGDIHPSKQAQERYPLDEYPCDRCADPNEGLPHLIDNGSEFYWHHQHDAPGSSRRSGCLRFGRSEHCGGEPRPGTATSLFLRVLNSNGNWIYMPRTEEEYLEAQRAVEEQGANDCRQRKKY